MPDSPSGSALGWHTLSARTTAVLLQLLLWALLCGFYFAWYNRPNYSFDGPIGSLVGLRMVFAIGLFNALVYLIIPRWLLRGRFWLALAGAVLLVYAYGLFNFYGYQLANRYLPVTPALARYYQSVYQPGLQRAVFSGMGLLTMALDMQANMVFPVVVSFLAYAQVVDRRRLALERNQLDLELRYLKAQINPRFLFNTLGTLHHFTRHRDPRAGDMVLHLADLMRYTLYEAETETVLLSRELEFLDDYLALERLRSRVATTIHHTISGPVTTQHIVPLVLYPFLERLFAGSETDSGTTITSTIEVTPYAVQATFARVCAAAGASGYGTDGAIRAARRRLQLQYPERHTVELTEDETSVRVRLHIQLVPNG
ncbi:histidine kinase [Hymenobacter fastidiosus]|uniref:Histidine kinase n=1 Tax=Hymenobacter fastidiosus TaxID=486264 RepID=A0ABP7S6E6_9BACT